MKLISVTAAIAVTLAALVFPAHAQDKSGPNVGVTAEGTVPGGPLTMGLAHDLYDFGVAQGDAVIVLAAAKLAASVETNSAEVAALDPAVIAFTDGDQRTLLKIAVPLDALAAPDPMTNDDTPRAAARATFFTAANEDEGAAKAPVTAEGMFAKVKELADDDDAVLGLMDDVMNEVGRERRDRSVERLSRLASGQTDVWEIPFYGNADAEVAIVGDGDANLDVAVTDQNGNVICSDVSWSDKLYCRWTPVWDGYFYVTVQNLGGSQNTYYLLTN